MRKPPHNTQPPTAVAEHSRLVQRLRRRYGDWLAHLPPGAPVADTMALGYARLRDFKRRFTENLKLALACYPEARIDVEAGGLRLHPSPSPIKAALKG